MSFPSPATRFFQAHLELLVVLVLVAAGLCIYGQTLGFPFISFDDPGYVYENPHVSQGLSWEGWRWAWTSFERSNWHPLTWLSLMLDAQIYGVNAGGYHLTNLLLHLVNGVLLFAWLRLATGARWPSALTALFFIVHPLHVESVAWVTERKDVLSTLFLCLTLLAYTRYARGAGRRYYWLALGLFALGLTAKPMLVTLPPLLLLLDFWPLRRITASGASWQKLVVEKIPFFALGAASSAVTVLAQRQAALVPLAALPMSLRLPSALLGCGTYLWKTIWPVDLGVYYPYWRTETLWGPAALGITLTVATAVAFLWRQRWPWLLVGWGWFLGTLVPVVGVVQVGGQAAADRYTYVPHIGLFIAVFWTGAALWARWPSARVGLAGLASLGACACLAVAHGQTAYWRGNIALYEHSTQVSCPSARLFQLLGDSYASEGRTTESEHAYRRAWQLRPNNPDLVEGLAVTLIKQGRYPEAVALLAPWRDQPQATPRLLNNLGFALTRVGRLDAALEAYRRCEQRFPEFALAHFGMADVLEAQGNPQESAAEDELGLKLRDDWLPSLKRLAWKYAQSPDPQARAAALALARRAVEVGGERDLACLNVLALANAASGHWDLAVNAAAEALQVASQPGAPAGAAAACRERLESYRLGKVPPARN